MHLLVCYLNVLGHVVLSGLSFFRVCGFKHFGPRAF